MIEFENLNKLNKIFFQEYQESFSKTLESGWYILGDNVKSFEENFATYCNTKHSIGVASGLDALFLCLKSFKFKKGSEVIVPANTYIATILAILHNGLTPVLVEPDIETYNIDPSKIEEKINSNTCAIMVVHLYGKCCEMDPIIDLCKNNNLKLIEDAAQAHGAKYNNQTSGSFGDFGAFSFYPTKNLGALGDGGGITTNDKDLEHSIRMLRNYGSEKKYYNDVIGYNSRLDEIQAGFLNVKLKNLNKINDHKNKLADIYFQNLKEDFIKPQKTQDNCYDVYHIFNVRHEKRDKLRQYLLDNDIKTEIHYPVSPNKQKPLKNMIKEEYKISEKIHDTTLSIPISYYHSEKDILRVIEIMNKF